ncbi:MBL fold metallo-hydrolase [Marinobacterium sp. AK62]|uniref:MBL fold metallo-hydrolase n=1 Tax=Marinobacterium alkalitolerans TaxID=1542925 RepID=A0ABS3ZFK3_9GAMM|nr:MBL fold metallo-hydrolase [Marinobacterium alkalitolerans]MBP0050100.1 MBL fold metallo-hydrolase [Marinobacterium alkalitolerans]
MRDAHNTPQAPEIKAFFDEPTNTFSYVVRDPSSSACAIIDSVLDFDYASGRTDVRSADAIIAYVREQALSVEWILETHVHADHLSAAPYLHEAQGGQTGIGDQITVVQDTFGKAFNAGTEFARDGSQFDRLFKEGDTFSIGNLTARVLHTPGHTPACLTYVIGDAAFVGDTLFMPDYGTARCDFPGGDARTLYRSIQKVLSLPGETRIFLCHDYKAPGRDTYCHETTVAEQRKHNVHVHEGISEDEFVRMRTERDATLKMPALILPSVQVNMRAGEMPPAEDNGQVYLKVPINLFS